MAASKTGLSNVARLLRKRAYFTDHPKRFPASHDIQLAEKIGSALDEVPERKMVRFLSAIVGLSTHVISVYDAKKDEPNYERDDSIRHPFGTRAEGISQLLLFSMHAKLVGGMQIKRRKK